MSNAKNALQLALLFTLPLYGCTKKMSEEEILFLMRQEAQRNTTQMLSQPTPTLNAENREVFVKGGSLTLFSDGLERTFPVLKYRDDIRLPERVTLDVPEEEPLIESTPLGTFLSVHRTLDSNALGGLISRLPYGARFFLNEQPYIITIRAVVPNGLPYGETVFGYWDSFFPQGITYESGYLPVFLNTCTLNTDFPEDSIPEEGVSTKFFIGALHEEDYLRIFDLPSSGTQ